MANADRSVDVPHCIVHIFEPLLRLLWPAFGRRRRPDHPSVGLAVKESIVRPARVPAARALRGEEIGLVPYLVAHAQWEEQKRQARRHTLRLAVRGVYIGPRLIHGVEAMA
ncbi:hypothetical protein ABZ027_23750 [Streptomyces sp. NPDC006332]|uniref:hypothetical protein n=1 Tax=Streptomyces sp. NPDC006332 TaxID=3155456 RepID=UPI0033BA313F